ncbi:transcriptional regulator, MarR family [Actinacidiphila yanglinensis]|uniref:Transcriptional regulator, MarR family n=1 Tax=Actinacidiphila yanglinensis TaxID=310779 RepID=A0A1H6E3T7_9ACTN|nr:MarR family winged helix-turn-helix transcriptional regulator [Actinacidiphila yanglinensis]SEG91676.1 transcriptional regulator, MarR family [Actinacidiphila yanglinensis]
MEDREVLRLRGQMRQLQRRLRREGGPTHGVSRTARQVLAAADRMPDAQPRRLAGELQMTSSNVAAALRELEAAGFVSRSRDVADARRVLVSVTPAGRAAVAGTRSERDTWLGRAVEALLDPEEQQVLIAAGTLLERLAGFEPTGAAGPEEDDPVRRPNSPAMAAGPGRTDAAS